MKILLKCIVHFLKLTSLRCILHIISMFILSGDLFHELQKMHTPVQASPTADIGHDHQTHSCASVVNPSQDH